MTKKAKNSGALAEERVRKLNRVYEVLSAVNHLVIRASDRKTLFEGACRILVETGLFRMAWVGVVDEAARLVRPVAFTGCEEGYLKDIRVSTDEVPEGSGPTGTAVRTARHFINNDTEHNPLMKPWRGSALARGYLASASFPLLLDGSAVGALTVYSSEPGFFDEEEVRLLDEMAGNLSFSMWSMDQQELRRKAEEEARRLNEELQALAEDALVGLYILQDGRFVYANRKVLDILGYGAEELLGMADLLELIYPDDRPTVRENLRRRLDGEVKTLNYEFRMLRNDGGTIWVEVLSSHTVYKGKPSIIGTAQDITERKKAEQRRKDFLAMVTHDLKSPLTSILVNAELVQLKHEETSKGVLEMVSRIEQSGTMLLNMVEEFLALSMFESGKVSLNRSPADPASLLQGTCRAFEAQARKKNLELKAMAEDGMTGVMLDRRYFQRALSNLVQNALNYTPAGGRITLEAGTRGEGDRSVVFSVTDTGPGIPAEDLDRVFEKYYQVPGSHAGGSGLGLAVVKAVAEAHGGKTELESTCGMGSCFRVVLPAVPETKLDEARMGSQT